MTKPICDVSSWQGDINFPLLISMTDGVIMRAGNGITPDVKFAANWSGLKDHPGLVGAYWFVRTDLSASAQAQLFHDRLLLSSATPDYLVMDAEADAAGLSQTALRMLYKAFLDKLASLRPGAKIAVYTRASYWDPQIGVAGWENSYPLWVAHYGVTVPAIPAAWSDWWLHQYSADGNNLGAAYGVASDDIDLNKLAVPISPIPPLPPVPPPSTALTYRVKTATLNVRSGPGANYPIVGPALLNWAIITALDVQPISATSVWVKHGASPDKWSAMVSGGVWYLERV